MEQRPNGAPLWRRRRRNCTLAIAWGVLSCLAGLTYSLLTGNQRETPTTDVLSALGIVLLVVGMAVVGLGALGWAYAATALPRFGGQQRQLAPPPTFRLGLVSWVVLVLVVVAAFCFYLVS